MLQNNSASEREGNVLFNIDGTPYATLKVIQGASTTSTQAFEKGTFINIYPRPASDKIWVEMNQPLADKITLNISNYLGVVVNTVEVDYSPSQKVEINIRNLPSGVYILSAVGNNSRFIAKFSKD